MISISRRTALALWGVLAIGLSTSAASVAWADSIRWNNAASSFRWNTSENNFRNGANTADVPFAPGDDVLFDGTAQGTVYLGNAGPSPVNAAPNSVSVTNGTYTLDGGRVTTGSLSVTGGNLRYTPAAGGNFGSGTITLGNGQFGYLPDVSSTLSNNFLITNSNARINADPFAGDATDGGQFRGSFSGTVTMNTDLSNSSGSIEGRNVFSGMTLDLNGADRIVTLHTGFIAGTTGVNSVHNATMFDGNIDGAGVNSVTIRTAGGGNENNWGAGVGGTGGWDVQNVIVSGLTGRNNPLVVDGDTSTFWSGVQANGGKVIVDTDSKLAAAPHWNWNAINDDYIVTVEHELRAGAELAGDSIFVQNGGKVSGIGELNGGSNATSTIDTTVNVGTTGTVGTLAPGLGVGTLEIAGDLVLGPNAVLEMELATLGAVGGTNDLISVSGDLTLDGTLDVTQLPGFGEDGLYPFLLFGGTLTDNGLLVTGLDLNEVEYFIEQNIPGQLDLRIQALPLTPEPSSFLLFAAMMGAPAWFTWRRRRKTQQMLA